MSLLLNRKYGSRLECLHSILRTIYYQGKADNFQLSDLKYNSYEDHTIIEHCPLLKQTLGRYYCPYLDNSLDSAKCYATQSIESDSTKSKAVSDTAGSLEALGFIKKNNKSYQITPFGEEFIQLDYLTDEMNNIIEKAVISYGPILGFLYKAYIEQGLEFNPSEIYIGYPKTKESISNLNLGSTNDSVVRTRSKLISWCLTAGLIESVKAESSDIPAHKLYRDTLNAQRIGLRRFRISLKAKSYFDATPHIKNPLFYSRLNKNVGSKRERNGATQRITEIEINPILLKRRYFLIKILNYAGNQKKSISMKNLVKLFSDSPDFNSLILDKNRIEDTIASELEIGVIVGIPFEVVGDNIIRPISAIEESVLEIDAPLNEIEIINDYLKGDIYGIFV